MRRICWILLFPLLLLLFSAMAVYGGARGAARVPEHTCHKLIGWRRCEPKKCMHECAKEPNGAGVCRDKNTTCFCTFYCKQPPM